MSSSTTQEAVANQGLSVRSMGRRRRDRRGAFTLLEILIATAILTIGLVSIVALFPVAINEGRKIIETSNSTVIAQSIAESIRDGIRNRKRIRIGRNNSSSTYFVLKHDGVKDVAPLDPLKERPNHDYYILLPRLRNGRKFTGGNTQARLQSIAEGKTFLYPETDSPANGNGDALRADNDADDDGDPDPWGLRIEKVYELGQVLDPNTRTPTEARLKDLDSDVLKQYSFAFTISPSFFDANAAQVREYMPTGRLFHVRIMVFRGFVPQTDPAMEPTKPVYELDFEVAI
ncbi:MAG: prepilin-type N-terminal cleavage/methylation domain-containing protein [Planctomycetota bacterium]